jgi:hypothetical protein
MDFHLQFPVPPFPDKINYGDKFLMLGSCFAENVAERMKKFKLDVCINPHGVLYNPESISIALKRYLTGAQMKEEDLFYSNDTWNSWEHHSRYSDPDKKKCLNDINHEIETAHQRIKNCKWLFITFGSAFSYLSNEKKMPVGNCHKLPNKEFTKTLLTVDLIRNEYVSILSKIKKINPDINVVFTVSPVRYIRDGVIENNLSKAILIQSVHELIKVIENSFYFPAYELIIDDLRDYRFYNTDLVHPNETAIEYVFEKFCGAAFSDESKVLFEKLSEIITAVNHKPFNEKSDSHKKFKENYRGKTETLQKQFPFLKLDKEIGYFT